MPRRTVRPAGGALGLVFDEEWRLAQLEGTEDLALAGRGLGALDDAAGGTGELVDDHEKPRSAIRRAQPVIAISSVSFSCGLALELNEAG